MKTIKNHKITLIDVDETLIFWDHFDGVPKITVDGAKGPVVLGVSEKLINRIKQHKNQGHINIVWSHGGYEFAEKVVKALELEEYIDVVMSKASIYYDDTPASDFMQQIDLNKDDV